MTKKKALVTKGPLFFYYNHNLNCKLFAYYRRFQVLFKELIKTI